MSRFAVLLWLFAGLAAAQGTKLTPVVMQLNWHAQADHGGYFAAKAEGVYEKHGLDVTLKPGGPQLNDGAPPRPSRCSRRRSRPTTHV